MSGKILYSIRENYHDNTFSIATANIVKKTATRYYIDDISDSSGFDYNRKFVPHVARDREFARCVWAESIDEALEQMRQRLEKRLDLHKRTLNQCIDHFGAFNTFCQEQSEKK